MVDSIRVDPNAPLAIILCLIEAFSLCNPV